MTYAEKVVERRNRLCTMWTVEDIVYGEFGPVLTTKSGNHAFDGHLRQLNASHSHALEEAVIRLTPCMDLFHLHHPTDFEDLYCRVEKIIASISGIGPLAIYDISLRIGCNLYPKVIPVHYVYVHDNKVKKSAKALLSSALIACGKIEVRHFSSIIPQYGAMEIENILCVYHDKIIKAHCFDINWLNQCP